MISFFKRIIKYGWQYFSRNGEMVFPNLFILTLALLLVSSLFLFRHTVKFIISLVQEKADVSIYFKEEAPEEEILSIEEEISKIPGIKEIKYTSREMALETFEEKHQENPLLLEALKEVGKNPFLASISVKASDPQQYEEILNLLKEKDSKVIEKIDYSERKPLIEKIFSFSAKIEKAIIFLSAVLILVAVLVAFTTIRLSILNFGEEIAVQRLVGASNWFIRGPFIVQGLIIALFSATLSFFLLFALVKFLDPKIKMIIPEINLFQIFLSEISFLLTLQFLLGISLEIVASLLAIRRYLKI